MNNVPAPGVARQKLPLFPLVVGPVFFALAFLIYLPALRGEFIWDDFFLVLENPLIRSPVLLLEVFRHHLIPDSLGTFYRPMQNWSFFLDYWRGGLSPWVFHQTNIAVHAANAVGLFLLSRRWIERFGGQTAGKSALLATLVSGVWLVHPAHNAAVAYVSGRADSLAMFFFLAAWWSWEKATEIHSQNRWIWLSGAVVAAFLAMLSKEMALIGLGFFLLHLWLFRADLSPSFRVKSTLSLLLIAGIYWMLRQLPANEPSPVGGATLWSERPSLILRALGDYARILLYPQRLLMERQVVDVPMLLRSPALSDPLFPWLGWLGGAFLLYIVGALFVSGKGRQLRWFGALWFGVTIWPVSNFFPLNATVAEHWLYLPSIGFLLLLTGVLVASPGKIQLPATLAVLLLAVPLGVRTWQRAKEWAEPKRFYEASIRDGGDSVRVRLNLASWYRVHHDLKTGEAILRSILARTPSYAAARQALALNLHEQGRANEAEALFRQNLQGNGLTLGEKALALDQLNEKNPPTDRLKGLRDVYAEHPQSWKVVRPLADALSQGGQSKMAAEIVRNYCEKEPWNYAAFLQLGRFTAAEGNIAGAVNAWQRAARLDIRDVNALDFAADLLAAAGKTAEAVDLQCQAIRRQPNREQYELLAAIYQGAGQEQEAAEARLSGLRLEKDSRSEAD